MEYGHGRIRMLAEAALMLMLAMPAACFQFQAQGSLLLRSSSVSRPERIPLQGVGLVCMAADGDPLRLHRASALRFMTAAVVANTLPVEAALTEDDEEESDDSQVIDLDGVDGKKLAILVGAFVFADVISAFLTGRSVIPFPFVAQQKDSDWKTKVLDQLLEDEKKKNAAKMGVSVTTESTGKGRVSSTGDYAKTDPFEIAKEKYKKKPSLDELKRDLSKKLDTKDEDDDDF